MVVNPVLFVDYVMIASPVFHVNLAGLVDHARIPNYAIHARSAGLVPPVMTALNV
jgi:hypothetical protein